MAIGALQTGYNTLYGKVAGLGTQNGQTRGSSFREHIDGTEKKAPYQHLAQNGTITYKGVTFVCDTDRNRITLGDVTDRSKCLNISLKGGGCLMVNRDNLSDLSQAITMFCPEDINRIMTAIAEDKRAQQMLLENAGVGAEELDPELGLLCRDIGAFRDSEIPKAISLIQTVARQINGELSAKRRGQAHSGKLDFRRTIRGSLSTGGSLHRLYFRKPRTRKRRLVILCDVSGSMVQFSEFALRFIQSLNQVAESSRTFLFSETVVEADAFQLQNMDRFRDTVRASGIYGRGTDLGLALKELCDSRPPILNQNTTLLILSDTKTVDTPRALAWLQEAKRQAGKLLWLNPIPERNWKYIKSAAAVQSMVPMIPCSTLGELAAACRRL